MADLDKSLLIASDIYGNMLTEGSVSSSQNHISVLMTGSFSNGQNIQGNSTNPVKPNSVELISYQLRTSRILDKLTAKSSTPVAEGVYIMVDHSNPAIVYFQQAANSSITVDLILTFCKNDDGTKPVQYGEDTLTACRVGSIIVCPYSPVGPHAFIALHPAQIQNVIGSATQKYDYVKGAAA